ncbi:hypothetical protein OG471_13350 [Streptomyces sp. NBC_01336]|uniref:hypothetical protein n=1 Tax=Streptomyces sp. NBC_01336 TaxID=2903829 RepID=UPI002E0E9177|nr:hypothetical protein OG471_13350 [Streptomyces sp. NBC_01336]
MGVGVGVGRGGVAVGDGALPVPPGSGGTPVVGDAGGDGGTEETGAGAAGAEVAPPGRASSVAREDRVAPGERVTVAGTAEGPPEGLLTGPGGSAVSLTVGSGAGAVVADVDSRT